jgi:CheY-like chemotaxis protein
MKILIVDDNDMNLYMLRSLLVGNGYEVIESPNGKDALEKVNAGGIDLIISDILMPVMDGFTLCREIRKHPKHFTIPFIVYTATYTGPQDEAFALEIGANRFLIKPCEPEVILRVMQEVIDESNDNAIKSNDANTSEEEILKLYNERLVRKLEQKMLQAEEEVNARKNAIDALHRSESLLNATQSISKTGGWEWDIKKQEMFWTRETYHIYELDPDKDEFQELDLAKITMDCFDDKDRMKITEAFKRCVEKGIPFDLECSFISLSNTKKCVRTAAKPVFEDDEIVKVFGSIQDISESKRIELEQIELREQLRQAQKLESIGQFAGGIAHDFNNILTIILGYSEEILSTINSNDPNFNYVSEIKKAGDRALSLTRQLLTFSRKHVSLPQVMNLNQVIQNLSIMLKRIIAGNIEFVADLADDLDNMKADVHQIEQVLMNLVINACEAMPEGGTIKVETYNIVIDEFSKEINMGATPGKYIKLVVSDTGCGMDKETARQVFEPFFTTKISGKGTGLGLSLVYGIVKQSKGFIKLDSQLQFGTQFTVLFPYTEEKPTTQIAGIEKSDSDNGNGEHLILVEDDPALIHLIKNILNKLKYTVTVFNTVDEAIAGITGQNLHPDLILTDVMLPGMNIKEFTERLRMLKPDLKVLFMSGSSVNLITQHLISDSEFSYIQKPFTKETIAKKINQILNKSDQSEKKKMNVLMIDDDKYIIELYERAFTRRGHNLKGSCDYEDALDQLQKKSFELVLVDLNIPGSDGLSVVKRIREAGFQKAVIILSGDIGNVNSEEFKQLGIVNCFEKSSNINPLFEFIEGL